MNDEDEKKDKNSNDISNNKRIKRKYFRIEKSKYHASKLKDKESKKIFKTQKEYHLKRKVFRESKRLKFHKSKKFITITKENSNFQYDKDNNSFVVRKIIPKKLKLIKEKKKESKNINYFSNQKDNILFKEKNNFLKYLFNDEKNNIINGNSLTKDLKNGEKNLNCYKIKLMLVYFYSIKNLCKYINNNFFNSSLIEQKAIDEFICQIYQSLQILDRKINEFKLFQNFKNNIQVNKDDFYDISSLKENLLLMKNTLNNSMSQNLINIYIDIDNFCQIYLAKSETI